MGPKSRSLSPEKVVNGGETRACPRVNHNPTVKIRAPVSVPCCSAGGGCVPKQGTALPRTTSRCGSDWGKKVQQEMRRGGECGRGKLGAEVILDCSGL